MRFLDIFRGPRDVFVFAVQNYAIYWHGARYLPVVDSFKFIADYSMTAYQLLVLVVFNIVLFYTLVFALSISARLRNMLFVLVIFLLITRPQLLLL